MLSKDTKEYKDIMARFSRCIFMGRAYGFRIILISQVFSSKVIDTELRAQCGIKVYLGQSISTENATMLFPGSSIDKSLRLPKYAGYISTPEKELDIIQIPYYDTDAMKELLKHKGQYYFEEDEKNEADYGR